MRCIVSRELCSTLSDGRIVSSIRSSQWPRGRVAARALARAGDDDSGVPTPPSSGVFASQASARHSRIHFTSCIELAVCGSPEAASDLVATATLTPPICIVVRWSRCGRARFNEVNHLNITTPRRDMLPGHNGETQSAAAHRQLLLPFGAHLRSCSPSHCRRDVAVQSAAVLSSPALPAPCYRRHHASASDRLIGIMCHMARRRLATAPQRRQHRDSSVSTLQTH